MTVNTDIILIDTAKIKPYNRNARNNDITVQKLCEIIEKVGFNQPIVVDKNNVIVKGHSRWKAAVKLGMKQIPCIISQNDEETNKLDRLADNKIQEFSTWNDEILATELASINIDDIDLSDFGFDFNFKTFEQSTPQPQYSYADEIEMPSESHSYSAPAYVAPEPDENYIKPQDIERTVPNKTAEYGSVTCPKCGTTVLYKK